MTNTSSDVEQIRDYLVGRLSEDERIAFEDRLARDPTLVSEFEESLQLRDGLRELRAQGYFAAATVKAQSQRTRGFWYRASLAAAAAIVGVSLLLAWRLNQESSVLTVLPAARPTSGAPLIAAQFTFVATRHGGKPTLALPPSGLIELRAAPGTRSAAWYRITLTRNAEGGAAQQRVGVATGLRLGVDGYLHCYADSSRLAPGSYELRIEAGEASPRDIQVFLFVLQPREETASP